MYSLDVLTSEILNIKVIIVELLAFSNKQGNMKLNIKYLNIPLTIKEQRSNIIVVIRARIGYKLITT